MSIVSLQYIAALFLLTILYYFLPSRFGKGLLLFAGILFYLSQGIRGAAVLFGALVLTYGVGLWMSRVSSSRVRRILLFVGVLILLAGWLSVREAAGRGWMLLPVGMSFYALQMISLLADLYTGKVKELPSPFDTAFLILFFPKVTMGPFISNEGFLRQLKEVKQFDPQAVSEGVVTILLGFFEKLVIANLLMVSVNRIFTGFHELHSLWLLAGPVLFTVYLYCDFAGYSHIAIGSAKVLGYEIPDNFRQPLLAASVQDFWRRWHIGLSTWLRDYVYIPLGGNRKGRARQYLNLFLTFLASGLWHGRGLHFILWGGYHGVLIVAENILGLAKKESRFFKRIHGIGAVLLAMLGFVFFECASLKESLKYCYYMLTHWNLPLAGFWEVAGINLSQLILLVLSLVVLVVIDLRREAGKDFGKRILTAKAPVRWAVCLCLCLIVALMMVRDFGTGAESFVYGRF
ncbi:MAG: hypothetical protein K6E84_01410 [Lachnospiraceae bacterium]|nr:hypothetical protein [Lachnospiraceae bacterium]